MVFQNQYFVKVGLMFWRSFELLYAKTFLTICTKFSGSEVGIWLMVFQNQYFANVGLIFWRSFELSYFKTFLNICT